MKLQISPTNQYSPFSKRAMTWTVIGVCSIVIALLFSKTAHAGLLSIMNSFLGGEQASAKTTVPRMSGSSSLGLQAYANIDPTGDLAEAVIPIEDREVLSQDLASINATGTDAQSSVISIYVVRSGDTLSGIAKMFNVSVNTIVWANDLSRSAALQTGQTLVILPVSGIKYTVKKGDTLKTIAKRYGADHPDDTLDDILTFNNLTSSSALAVGQTVIIPAAEPAPGDIQAPAPAANRGRLKVAPNEPTDVPWWTWPLLPGYFTRPIAGGVKSQGLHGHNAVDLADRVGTPIHAAAAGTVIIARNSGYNGGYGSFVVISHANGTQTLYSHMSRTAVSAGATVYQGQTIGYIGMTGLTTGPHVHFEIRGAQNPF